MTRKTVAIIGYGKIAIDQHLPAIAAHPDFELAAVVSARGAGPAGVPVFTTIAALIGSGLRIDASAHCNTPDARFATALAAIGAGHHVLLEKPPTAALGQVAALEQAAAKRGTSLMTAWHSQANDAVRQTRDWLIGKRIDDVRIDWRENVRKWHPGQAWIWEAGGFGVFDPGINALSIATHILPFAPFVSAATLTVPANRQMPIAAALTFGAAEFAGTMTAGFDWRESDDEVWQIAIKTDAGNALLSGGGRALAIDGQTVIAHGDDEYPALYGAFSALIAQRKSAVDVDPLRIVAEAFLVGNRVTTDAFVDDP
jgi:D-galactose 1-dehydrogenase